MSAKPHLAAVPESDLDRLAREARIEHDAAARAWESAVEHAYRCGGLLIEAKALCGHGGWLPWLADVGIPERTARRYMQVAKSANRADLPATITDALRLSLTDAQQRYLGEIRAAGEKTYDGRARRSLNALISAGLIEANVDYACNPIPGEWSTPDLCQRITCRAAAGDGPGELIEPSPAEQRQLLKDDPKPHATLARRRESVQLSRWALALDDALKLMEAGAWSVGQLREKVDLSVLGAEFSSGEIVERVQAIRRALDDLATTNQPNRRQHEQ